MDRSSETNGTTGWNDEKERKSHPALRQTSNGKRHMHNFCLDSSNKTKRNEKVTEWLSLDLLGSLLQIFDGALQA